MEGEKKKIIAVFGASSGAGATFTATKLAMAMAAKTDGVTYLETHICDCFACRRKPLVFYGKELRNSIFAGRFADFFYMKFLGDETAGRANLYKGVNWAVRTDCSPCCTLLPVDVAGRYVIWDNPPEKNAFESADLIFCVLVPKREHVMAGAEFAKDCLKAHIGRTKLVFNRVNSASELRHAESYIGRKADFVMPEGTAEAQKTIDDLAEYILTLY